MKKITLITALFLMFFGFAQEQDENSDNEKKGFNYDITAKLGFSEINSRDVVTVYGNSAAVSFDFSYYLKNDFRLMTGLQLTEVFTNFSDTSLEASMIMIPLRFRDKLYNYDEQTKIRPFLGAGLYTNYFRRLTLDSQQFGRDRETGIGWNFGWLVEIGTTFRVNQSNEFVISFESQNDFTNTGDQSFRFANTFFVMGWTTKF